jgi:lactoylglutathione lyase
MAVLRIVTNIETADPGLAQAFYGDILGLGLVMDHGWIRTYACPCEMAPQVSFASQRGSGTPVPDLSIEVDTLDKVHAEMTAAGFAVVYPLTDEPWGVRRFFVRDPFGRLVNILSHEA